LDTEADENLTQPAGVCLYEHVRIEAHKMMMQLTNALSVCRRQVPQEN
jgi:hypothetical protein